MSRAAAISFTVKICGITTLEDGQHAVDAGATALGFNFYPHSPRYLRPQAAGEIAGAIRGTYVRVGVFANATLGELEEATAMVDLDVLQLHGTLPAELPKQIRLWRAVPADVLPEPDSRFELYLIDTPCAELGGSGRAFDWSLANAFKSPYILAGGLTPENVGLAIRSAHPAGVDACSRLESSPGRKNAAAVTRFIEAALTAHNEDRNAIDPYHDNNTVIA